MKTRCGICGETIQVKWSAWTNPHVKTTHPKYAKWVRDWFSKFVAVIAPMSVAWWIFFAWFWNWYPTTLDIKPLFIAIFLYLVPTMIMLFEFIRKQQQFRHEWKNSL